MQGSALKLGTGVRCMPEVVARATPRRRTATGTASPKRGSVRGKAALKKTKEGSNGNGNGSKLSFSFFNGETAVKSSSAARGLSVKAEEEDAWFEDPEVLRDGALLILRLAISSMILHHGQEKYMSADLFTKYVIDSYFPYFPGPHMNYTYLIAIIQFFGPFFLGSGVFSRIAAGGLAGTMGGAVFYHLLSTGPEGFPFTTLKKVPVFHNYAFEAPVIYTATFFFLMISGPGRFSVSQLLGWNEENEDGTKPPVWRQ